MSFIFFSNIIFFFLNQISVFTIDNLWLDKPGYLCIELSQKFYLQTLVPSW